jgi:hypothetical protein
MERIIKIGESTSIVTTNKPDCSKSKDGKHSWNGDTIITFHNDDRVMTESKYKQLTRYEQEDLNRAIGS